MPVPFFNGLGERDGNSRVTCIDRMEFDADGFIKPIRITHDVVHALPREIAVQQFLAWLKQFSLGRKRLLDTLLAATYRQAPIQSPLTTKQAHFAVFGVINWITPQASATNP